MTLGSVTPTPTPETAAAESAGAAGPTTGSGTRGMGVIPDRSRLASTGSTDGVIAFFRGGIGRELSMRGTSVLPIEAARTHRDLRTRRRRFLAQKPRFPSPGAGDAGRAEGEGGRAP